MVAGLIALIVSCIINASTARVALSGSQPSIVSLGSIGLSRPLAPNKANELQVSARIARGSHINSDSPGQYYFPTRLILGAPPGVKVGKVAYPPARKIVLGFAPGEELPVFSGQAKFRIPFEILGNLAAGPGSAASVRVDYQACNHNECLPPSSVAKLIDLSLLQVTPAAHPAALFPFDAVKKTAFSEATEPGLLGAFFAHRGYLLGFLVVLLGGLALNLTPCVYPLIGVTVAYFGNQGGGPRKVLLLAVLYVLGIALTFSSVGVGAALSGGLFGAALQSPYVLSCIAALLLVSAAASLGLFSLQPPQWLMRHTGTARPGYAGALMMGVGMGVVAAPCIGPIVLGLLLMVQQRASAVFGFALFFTLAIGLGLPYIALALAAGSIWQLPRSGEWLAWIEQALGFLLVGLALYFLDPVIPGRWMTWLLPYYAVGASIFLGFGSRAGRSWRPFLVVRYAVGLIAVGGLVYLLVVARNQRVELAFQPFVPALLQNARAERRPVVLDFSADWCVPCREMERTTFLDPAVVKQAGDFVLLKANLTAANSRNNSLLKQFNVAGVPTTVFIDADGRVRAKRAGYLGPREFLKYLRQADAVR